MRGYESPTRPLNRRRVSDFESPSIDPRRRAEKPVTAALDAPDTPVPRSHRVRRTLLEDNARSTAKAKAPQRLTAEQARVVGLVTDKKSVFFTGSAGTGKSFLLRHLLRTCRDANRRVYATATTGIAAHNIGGMTLHHFAGLDTRASANAGDLVRQVQQKKDALARWRDVDVLVIDEVSMMDGRLFDGLEAIARRLRHDTRFFGGIQLVLSGDFFQLPPVAKERYDVVLCFESTAWRRGVADTVVLKDVFRQSNAEFVGILNAFRVGSPTSAMISKLNERCSISDASDNDAIHIFTHNNDVLQVWYTRPSSPLVVWTQCV